MISSFLAAKETPHHRWHGAAPDSSSLRVFGASCWYVPLRYQTRKLDPSCRPALMKSHSSQCSVYKLWDRDARRMLISRKDTFHESDSLAVFSSEHGTTLLIPAELKDNIYLVCSPGSSSPSTSSRDSASPSSVSLDISSPLPLLSYLCPGLRRFFRLSKPLGTWWIAKPFCSCGTPAQISFIASDTRPSYSEAMSQQNKEF